MNAVSNATARPATRESPRCLECGGAIAAVLARLGSIRCHDCRY